MKETILSHVLELYFHVNHNFDIEDVKKYLSNPSVSSRWMEFKNDLAYAISTQSINPTEFERLTGDDCETQEEVNDFLTRQIWQPLYGNEPVEV